MRGDYLIMRSLMTPDQSRETISIPHCVGSSPIITHLMNESSVISQINAKTENLNLDVSTV